LQKVRVWGPVPLRHIGEPIGVNGPEST